ncbi:hypothetical protein HRbin02_01235 [Candidatus Calditenuaceae archaeon HR02]|nr:hypothetical protein HRbin02_01235 [Candidatus Calditenuaceae archaeon HR02]
MINQMSDEEIISEAIKIVNEGEKRGVILRILGALAIRIHSNGLEALHKGLGRLGENTKGSFTDIDLIGYSSQRAGVRELMEKYFSFVISRQFLLLYGKERLVYYHPDNLYRVDIFFDKLSFSHEIQFRKKGSSRLELDSPTITVSDLLLEKLQIHQINEKDIKDIIVLLRAHDVGEGEGDRINLQYISNILCDDWGFWMDATENLRKTMKYAEKYFERSLISQEDLSDVNNKCLKILDYLEECPKTKNWEKRARKGVKEKYWREVEELYR